MSLKNDNGPNDGGWDNYKIYVVDCLKKLSDSGEKIEKEINDIRLEFITNIYKNKEEYQAQLKDLANTVLKLQIRLGIICAGLTIFISILANILIRLVINEVK